MKTIFVDAINAFIVSGKGIYHPMFDLLERYPNRKIIMTGAKKEDYEKLGLSNMPYEVFTLSHDPEKFEPVYYETALQNFNLDPKEVVCFEHKEDAIKSAESAGITSYHYDKNKKDLAELDKFLKENL